MFKFNFFTLPTYNYKEQYHSIRWLQQLDTGSQLFNLTLAGWLSVFHFKIHETRPEPKALTFPNEIRRDLVKIHRDLVQIFWDLVRSRRYSTRSRPNPDRFLPNLAGFSQISALAIKLKTDPTQPETNKTRTEKSNQIIWVGFGSYFPPPESFGSSPGWAQTRPDPTYEQP